MTNEEYQKHVKEFLAEMKAVTDAKNPDYSAGTTDAMANYYELAAAAGITPIQAWMCLMMKHVTAIMRYSKIGYVTSEPIRGRLIDLANYAMLGAALIDDIANKSNGENNGTTTSVSSMHSQGTNTVDAPIKDKQDTCEAKGI